MRIAVAGSTGLVGSEVVAAAEAAGHSVVSLSLEDGIDLTSAEGLDERLAGVEALIDVTQSPTIDIEAVTFFETVAANLGDAAISAGVPRTVVLSIIGADRVPQYGYYVAKVAQENTHRRHSPGLHVLRAAQFLDYPGMLVRGGRDGNTTAVDDLLSQPVAVEEIARLLLELATGERDDDVVELAGPQQERIVELARRLVAHRGQDLTVIAREVPAPMRDGALLPGPDAVIAGPTFDEWLAMQPA